NVEAGRRRTCQPPRSRRSYGTRPGTSQRVLDGYDLEDLQRQFGRDLQLARQFAQELTLLALQRAVDQHEICSDGEDRWPYGGRQYLGRLLHHSGWALARDAFAHLSDEPPHRLSRSAPEAAHGPRDVMCPLALLGGH